MPRAPQKAPPVKTAQSPKAPLRAARMQRAGPRTATTKSDYETIESPALLCRSGRFYAEPKSETPGEENFSPGVSSVLSLLQKEIRIPLQQIIRSFPLIHSPDLRKKRPDLQLPSGGRKSQMIQQFKISLRQIKMQFHTGIAQRIQHRRDTIRKYNQKS